MIDKGNKTDYFVMKFMGMWLVTQFEFCNVKHKKTTFDAFCPDIGQQRNFTRKKEKDVLQQNEYMKMLVLLDYFKVSFIFY